MNAVAPNRETGVLTAEVQRLKSELERLQAPRQFHYGDALGFLRAVYNNEALPLHVRLDAARTAIKYETPSLAAVAVQAAKEDTIAEQLAAGRKRAVLQRTAGPFLITDTEKKIDLC
jgi:hypothetical protein